MSKLYRRFARLVTDIGQRYFAVTYGDTASMHAGPCQRCVGRAVIGAMESPGETTYSETTTPLVQTLGPNPASANPTI